MGLTAEDAQRVETRGRRPDRNVIVLRLMGERYEVAEGMRLKAS